MSDLLPCPFCGGEAKYYYCTYSDGEYDKGVKCTQCDIHTGTYMSLDQAKTYWNKRVGDESNVIRTTNIKEVGDIKISNTYYNCEICNNSLNGNEKFCPECGVKLKWE